jgi:hypothetical protein
VGFYSVLTVRIQILFVGLDFLENEMYELHKFSQMAKKNLFQWRSFETQILQKKLKIF